VAAHEVGHALQDADDYVPMRVRAQLVPAAQIGSNLGPWLFIIGLMLQLTALAQIGLYLFAAAASCSPPTSCPRPRKCSLRRP